MGLYFFLNSAAVCAYIYMGYYVLRLSPKSPVNRSFTASVMLLALWAGGYLFMIHPDSAVQANIGFILYCFAWYFLMPIILLFALHLSDRYSRRTIHIILVADLLAAAVLYALKLDYFFSLPTICIVDDLWIEIVSVGNPNTIVFALYFILHIVFVVLLLRYWAKRASGKRQKAQARAVAGAGLAMLGAIVLELLLLFILKRPHLTLAPMTAFIWIFGFWQAITRFGFLAVFPQLGIDDITRQMNDMFLMTDENGIILKMNEKFCELSEYSHNEAMDKKIDSFFKSEETVFGNIFEEYRTGQTDSTDAQTELVPKDGEAIPVGIESSALYDNDGDFIGAVFLIEDLRPTVRLLKEIDERIIVEQELRYIRQNLEQEIQKRSKEILAVNANLMKEISERKNIEADLERESEFLAKIISLNPYGIMVTNANGQSIVQNKAFEEVIGKIPPFDKPVLDKSIVDLFGIEPYLREIRRGRTVRFPIIRIKSDENARSGNYYDISLGAVGFGIFDKRRKLQNVVFMFEDVTERRIAEEKTQKALEKERDLNELKTRFINMASHEFKTPLSTIILFTDLLKNHGSQIPPMKKLEYFDKIHQAIRHMNQLLNDVLIIGKTDADKIIFSPQPGDLKKFCKEVVGDIMLSWGNDRKITTHFHISDGDVQFDEKLLRHILENLLTNALKYSSPDQPVALDVRCDGKTASIVVSDNGIGIEPDDLPKIFDTFHRGRNVGIIEGTGLGLTIVKRYVELHKGTIEVESTVNQGTTFKVIIPVK